VREPWFLRPAGDLPVAQQPADLDVVRVSTPGQVAEFEDVSMRGLMGEDASVQNGTIHPASTLADPRMTMLTGRVGDNAVAAAMSYRSGEAVGIYGVTTIASTRGRGYASALTHALIDPALPALLSSSPAGANLYRRLGFEQVGELGQWQRP
jgi:predicted GNAT family acetyltransferase